MSPEKLKDYSEHHVRTAVLQPHTRPSRAHWLCALLAQAMTYHFPDAYAGQNVSNAAQTARPRPHCSRLVSCRTQTKIRDTLNNLILKSPQNWQTSVGLPFFQIEGTVVEWGPQPRP